jgi:hypothetical protein
MKSCSQCGIKTKHLGFIDPSGHSYLGKNYGKTACFDCVNKIKNGKDIKWIGKPSKETIKLIKIINDLGYKVKPRLFRTYAGHWQRSSGAFLWYMEQPDSSQWIGSGYQVKDIINAKKVFVNTSSGSIELEISNK